ncbi:uncharacterized protein EV422DRAFT_502737 [Fimicolochytrium jonesii]|uniref:uncharacterized protein n=1 Tax=Fimicolochytrium jonesii TaxID=1396493 RepID=UPI0022FE32CF|nr:uncharacterized protein EV422DRAFT_502737 [Fimicolochytrium jonesii]KAI8827017.1 hypothetical protein EV422DRAFT_502737 [Fimicolochytrium jonesii]
MDTPIFKRARLARDEGRSMSCSQTLIDYFGTLPPELLEEIFSLVPNPSRLVLASRTWHAVSESTATRLRWLQNHFPKLPCVQVYPEVFGIVGNLSIDDVPQRSIGGRPAAKVLRYFPRQILNDGLLARTVGFYLDARTESLHVDGSPSLTVDEEHMMIHAGSVLAEDTSTQATTRALLQYAAAAGYVDTMRLLLCARSNDGRNCSSSTASSTHASPSFRRVAPYDILTALTCSISARQQLTTHVLFRYIHETHLKFDLSGLPETATHPSFSYANLEGMFRRATGAAAEGSVLSPSDMVALVELVEPRSAQSLLIDYCLLQLLSEWPGNMNGTPLRDGHALQWRRGSYVGKSEEPSILGLDLVATMLHHRCAVMTQLHPSQLNLPTHDFSESALHAFLSAALNPHYNFLSTAGSNRVTPALLRAHDAYIIYDILQTILQRDFASCLRLLLESGLDPDLDNRWPLRLACLSSAKRCVRELVVIRGVTPALSIVRETAAMGHEDVLKMLLGIESTDRVNHIYTFPSASSPISTSFGQRRSFMPPLGEKPSKPVDIPRATLSAALIAASENNRPCVAQLLLRHGADPCASNGLPLRIALARGFTTVVRILIEWGAELPEALLSEKTCVHDRASSILSPGAFKFSSLPGMSSWAPAGSWPSSPAASDDGVKFSLEHVPKMDIGSDVMASAPLASPSPQLFSAASSPSVVSTPYCEDCPFDSLPDAMSIDGADNVKTAIDALYPPAEEVMASDTRQPTVHSEISYPGSRDYAAALADVAERMAASATHLSARALRRAKGQTSSNKSHTNSTKSQSSGSSRFSSTSTSASKPASTVGAFANSTASTATLNNRIFAALNNQTGAKSFSTSFGAAGLPGFAAATAACSPSPAAQVGVSANATPTKANMRARSSGAGMLALAEEAEDEESHWWVVGFGLEGDGALDQFTEDHGNSRSHLAPLINEGSTDDPSVACSSRNGTVALASEAYLEVHYLEVHYRPRLSTRGIGSEAGRKSVGWKCGEQGRHFRVKLGGASPASASVLKNLNAYKSRKLSYNQATNINALKPQEAHFLSEWVTVNAADRNKVAISDPDECKC